MHEQQIEWCKEIKARMPERFDKVSVCDCGSMDINGTNHYLFTNYFYLGIDLAEGPNVHVKSMIHKVQFVDNIFDLVISTNHLEHDKHWKNSLKRMVRMVRSGGFMIFTCSCGHHEHGTKRCKPERSPSCRLWPNYYRNLTEKDIRDVFDPDAWFFEYEFSVSEDGKDLRFWGIKK